MADSIMEGKDMTCIIHKNRIKVVVGSNNKIHDRRIVISYGLLSCVLFYASLYAVVLVFYQVKFEALENT